MVGHCLGRLGHRLQKVILLRQVVPHFGHIPGPAGRVYPRLAGRRGDTDGHVLDGTAEAAHRMPFEMREDNDEIVIGKMGADEILLQVSAALHGQSHFTVGIHDIHRSDCREAVFLSGPAMRFRIGTTSAVSRIALYYRSVHPPYQILYQRRLQIVVAARFARGELHGHLAGGLPAENLINLYKILRVYLFEHVHFRYSGRCGPSSGTLCTGTSRSSRRECQGGHCHTNALFHIRLF